MTDLMGVLKTLNRPRLLISAARFGVPDYSRPRDLARVLRTLPLPLPAPGRAIGDLMTEEVLQEDKRSSGDASYSIARHIDVLIALMAEERLLRECYANI